MSSRGSRARLPLVGLGLGFRTADDCAPVLGVFHRHRSFAYVVSCEIGGSHPASPATVWPVQPAENRWCALPAARSLRCALPDARCLLAARVAALYCCPIFMQHINGEPEGPARRLALPLKHSKAPSPLPPPPLQVPGTPVHPRPCLSAAKNHSHQ